MQSHRQGLNSELLPLGIYHKSNEANGGAYDEGAAVDNSA